MRIKALIIILCLTIPTFFDIPIIQPNRLEIESTNIKEYIYSGYANSLMDKGLLIDPKSLETNNWVVYGHRFSKRNPLRMYLRDLDKVRIGDEITLYLKNKEYRYVVSEKFEVFPSDLWVVAPTQEPTITIITCTPIMMPSNRLIIVGKLVSIR